MDWGVMYGGAVKCALSLGNINDDEYEYEVSISVHARTGARSITSRPPPKEAEGYLPVGLA